MKKSKEANCPFRLNAAKEFFNILLNRKFVGAFGNRDKIKALTENRFL